MNGRPTLNDLTAFALIARYRSFRKAADELGVAPSTLSHLMRTLERNLDARLLHRTTRSVSLTEAGERLLGRLQPALRHLDQALEAVDELRGAPCGTLRINSNVVGARLLQESAMPVFLARYPDMAVDLVTEGRLIDIVAQGFDAGVRLVDAVPQDMIAVAFGGDIRFVAVASPTYLAQRPRPRTPDDLRHHECIRFRLPSGKFYRWEFERHGEQASIDVPGRLTLDDLDLMAEAAVQGRGIAYMPEQAARPYIASGQLIVLLDDWCPVVPGLALYYPGYRHVPAGLRAFIEVLRAQTPSR